jgi:dynactin complex subunit
MDETERRLALAEENIRELFRKEKEMRVMQAKTETTLENLNITLRELREAMSYMRNRPGQLWDKVIYALIAALVSAVVAALLGGALG